MNKRNNGKTMTGDDGTPLFVGRDVATALGYKYFRDALRQHVDPEDKGVVKCDSLGGTQKMTVINESSPLFLQRSLFSLFSLFPFLSFYTLPSFTPFTLLVLKQGAALGTIGPLGEKVLNKLKK